MNLRLAADGRAFPSNGIVSIRRGADHTESGERIEDSFRQIESCAADDTGEHVAERFGVTLFTSDAAFDRLTGRAAHWSLPDVLVFDAASEVVTHRPGEDVEDLLFRLERRPWERISSATLMQRPPSAAGS